jgi:hypothetical protein
MTSINQNTNTMAVPQDATATNRLLQAILDDLTALRTTVAALQVDTTSLDTALDTLVAKMNLDAGITDTDYAGAAAMTASAPDALTLEE